MEGRHFLRCRELSTLIPGASEQADEFTHHLSHGARETPVKDASWAKCSQN